jgi:multiple sugar transport system permease protein
MTRTRRLWNSLAYLIMALLSVVFLVPFAWMVRSSFMTLGDIFILPPIWFPKPLQWHNYRDAMTIVPFGRYFANTLTVLVASMVGLLFSSTLAAFSFARIRWSGRDMVFGIILTSMMLPGAVTLIPQFVGWRTLGLYNTFFPLIVPAFFGGGAFNIFLLRQFYMTIPMELDEAAFVDGASYFQIYRMVILPLSVSAIIVVGLFAFMYHWNDFFNPLIYLENEAKYTIALGLQQFQGSYNARWNLLMAASTVVIIPAIIVFLIGQRYFIEGITLTGLKG